MGVVPHATDAPESELHQTSQGKKQKARDRVTPSGGDEN